MYILKEDHPLFGKSGRPILSDMYEGLSEEQKQLFSSIQQWEGKIESTPDTENSLVESTFDWTDLVVEYDDSNI